MQTPENTESKMVSTKLLVKSRMVYILFYALFYSDGL